MLAACSCVLEEEGAGGCAGCLLVCPRFVDHFFTVIPPGVCDL